MKTNTRGPNQGTIANALVPILVVRLKFNRADELDKLWIEVEDVEEAVGENPEKRRWDWIVSGCTILPEPGPPPSRWV